MQMAKTSFLESCEITINSTIRRLSMLEGKNKKALECEFREWIDAIQSEDKDYDILYINKIN